MIKRILSSSGPFLALLALIIVCAFTSTHFLSAANLLNISRQVSYSGIIALGMTFVIVGGGIDLSVGSLFAFAGVAAAVAMRDYSVPGTTAGFLIGLGAAMLAALVGGALNAALVTLGGLPPFIATLGTYSIFRSAALYFADSGTVAVDNPTLERIGGGALLGLPAPAFVMLALAVLFEIVLSLTVFGRRCCASGANERVARYSGVRVGRIRAATYMISGLCAGIGAFLFLGRLGSIPSSDAGSLYELDAIAAVIIGGAAMSGGRGTMRGTLAGIFILGVVSTALDFWGVSANLKGVVKGAVIISAVLMQRKRTCAN
ncbi:MAG: ABC transporter permease [Kiritimatiellaeota bacterium]|nr:ABC transporter permease [Kiritimatiellota bacterium]